MSMADLPLEIEGKTYQGVLSCIDVFSRYFVPKPLYSKDMAEVSEQLVCIFADRGTEFLGYATTLSKAVNVKILHSSVKHPDSQSVYSYFIDT